jgi:hypothetical protein
MTRHMLLGTTIVASLAFAAEVAGVKVPDSVTVQGKELKLNGAGIRKKIVFKVYVGALYLEAPSTDAAAIISAEQAKSVHMYFLRDVAKDKIMEAFHEGFQKNSPDQAAGLEAKLGKLSAALSDLKDGDEMVVTYVPGAGTTVTQGGHSVSIEGKEFADALFRNWLGKTPADDDMKAKMLGGK